LSQHALKKFAVQQTIHVPTPAHNGPCDITRQLEAILAESGVQTGIVNPVSALATPSS
jgi:thiamine phosphate synthase YjbQ (UPF0047 family)